MKTKKKNKVSNVVYLRPPAPPKPKRLKPKSAWQEFRDIMFKYRVQMTPFIGTLWLAALCAVLGPVRVGGVPVGTLGFLALGTVLVWLITAAPEPVAVHVPWFQFDRPAERWYAAACAGTAALWSVGATWNATGPGPRAGTVSVLLTAACAAPWWHHRRVRGSIMIRFDGLSGVERKQRLNEARTLIREWTAFTSAGHAQGARLRGITYTPWSACLHSTLRRGATIQEFTPLRLAKLESAFGEVQAGSVRVERVGRSSRLANFRFMLADPHAEPVPPPEDDKYSIENIPFGLFETGERVLFELRNTLIAGTTGAGKSGVINMLIRACARIPNVAIIGIDMKPGQVELGPWRGVMHALAGSPAEASELLDKVRAGMALRGAILESQKRRKWIPTKEAPFILLVVDEIQELKRAKLTRKLEDVAALCRAFGGAVVCATQHPITDNFSSTLKSLCTQRIGCHVEDQSADRVIFGESAGRNGWRPSMIPVDRPGSFLIRSGRYKAPLLARAYWLDDLEIQDEAAAWMAVRTLIDHQTWNQLEAGQTNQPDEITAASDIVDAEIVREDDPAELILDAMERRGRHSVKSIAEDSGIPHSSVYRWLGKLRDQGLVDSPARGRWVSLRSPGEFSPGSQ
jgi:hypothetical protein